MIDKWKRDLVTKMRSVLRRISRILIKPSYRVVILDSSDPSFSQQMRNELTKAGFDVLSESEFVRAKEDNRGFSVDATIGEFFCFDDGRFRLHKIIEQFQGLGAQIHMISAQRYQELHTFQPYPKTYPIHSSGIHLPRNASPTIIKPEKAEDFAAHVKERIEESKLVRKQIAEAIRNLPPRDVHRGKYYDQPPPHKY